MAQKKENGNMMRYAGLATQWLVLLGVAVWLGLRLDAWTKWKFPLFVVLLPLAALVVSLWQLVREFNQPKK